MLLKYFKVHTLVGSFSTFTLFADLDLPVMTLRLSYVAYVWNLRHSRMVTPPTKAITSVSHLVCIHPLLLGGNLIKISQNLIIVLCGSPSLGYF